MKLTLTHGAQSVEHEFLGRTGTSLTNAQATAGINAAYRQWAGDEYDPDATVLEKAAFLLDRMADHMRAAARRQRTGELQARPEGTRETQVETELG